MINKNISQEFYNKIKRKEEVKNITNELSEYQSSRDNKNDICNFYVNMLVQIKTILLVNKQSLTLNILIIINNLKKNYILKHFANTLLNSSEIITNTIHSVDHLANILVELSKIYSELFTIEKNSVIGKVVVLHNKNFQIPNKEDIYNILYKNDN